MRGVNWDVNDLEQLYGLHVHVLILYIKLYVFIMLIDGLQSPIQV